MKWLAIAMVILVSCEVERVVEVEVPLVHWVATAVEVDPQIVHPAPGPVSSGFGFRRGYGGQAGFHRGLDVAIPVATPVVSPVSGIVVEHWPPPGGRFRGHPVYGGAVWIQDPDRGLLVLLAHLSVTQVREGQRVEAGQMIGRSGNTGWSTGPHLHIEVWIDPARLIGEVR